MKTEEQLKTEQEIIEQARQQSSEAAESIEAILNAPPEDQELILIICALHTYLKLESDEMILLHSAFKIAQRKIPGTMNIIIAIFKRALVRMIKEEKKEKGETESNP